CTPGAAAVVRHVCVPQRPATIRIAALSAEEWPPPDLSDGRLQCRGSLSVPATDRYARASRGLCQRRLRTAGGFRQYLHHRNRYPTFRLGLATDLTLTR